jgi:hypothetical protein
MNSGAWEKIAFIRALDSIVDYHNLVRERLLMTTVPVAPAPIPAKKSKFVSFLDAVGHDFRLGLDKLLPIVETAGETAVSIFMPGVSPLFNQSVAAIVTAEQSAAAIGQQSGTGTQKAAAVVSLMGPLISQTLTDAGKSADNAAVQKYISAVVTILNAIPATAYADPVAQAPAAPAGTPVAAPAVVVPQTPAPAPVVSGMGSAVDASVPSGFESISG